MAGLKGRLLERVKKQVEAADREGRLFTISEVNRQEMGPSSRIWLRFTDITRGRQEVLSKKPTIGDIMVGQMLMQSTRQRTGGRDGTPKLPAGLKPADLAPGGGSTIPPPADIGDQNFAPFVLSLPERQEVVLGGVRGEPTGKFGFVSESFIRMKNGMRRFRTQKGYSDEPMFVEEVPILMQALDPSERLLFRVRASPTNRQEAKAAPPNVRVAILPLRNVVRTSESWASIRAKFLEFKKFGGFTVRDYGKAIIINFPPLHPGARRMEAYSGLWHRTIVVVKSARALRKTGLIGAVRRVGIR